MPPLKTMIYKEFMTLKIHSRLTNKSETLLLQSSAAVLPKQQQQQKTTKRKKYLKHLSPTHKDQSGYLCWPWPSLWCPAWGRLHTGRRACSRPSWLPADLHHCGGKNGKKGKNKWSDRTRPPNCLVSEMNGHKKNSSSCTCGCVLVCAPPKKSAAKPNTGGAKNALMRSPSGRVSRPTQHFTLFGLRGPSVNMMG